MSFTLRVRATLPRCRCRSRPIRQDAPAVSAHGGAPSLGIDMWGRSSVSSESVRIRRRPSATLRSCSAFVSRTSARGRRSGWRLGERRGLAGEDSAEERRRCRTGGARGAVALASLALRHSSERLLDVVAAAGPGCLAAGGAGGGRAHSVTFLVGSVENRSIPRGVSQPSGKRAGVLVPLGDLLGVTFFTQVLASRWRVSTVSWVSEKEAG